MIMRRIDIRMDTFLYFFSGMYRSRVLSSNNIFAKLKAGTIHSWGWFKNGSILFRKNMNISRTLFRKKLNGDELNYREHALMVRTTSDILKLIPFSFFVIVPFAELALPIVLKLCPTLLPSTFDANKLFVSFQGESERSRRLRAKKELFMFFQEVSVRNDLGEQKLALLSEFKKYLHDTEGKQNLLLPNIEELQKFSTLFEEQFRLENMKLVQLESICHLVDLTPASYHSQVVIQLKKHVNAIRKEDRNIAWEGIDSLSIDDLIEANKKRAMPVDHGDLEQLKSQLQHWIDLSSNKKIPVSMLLWSRALFVTENSRLLDIGTDIKVSENGVPSTVIDIHSDTDSSLRIQRMSEDVMRRISELEKLEQDIVLKDTAASAQDQVVTNAPATPQDQDQFKEHIRLMEQQSELIKSQLMYLNRMRKLKNVKRFDMEHSQIQKIFQIESKRLEAELRKFKQD